MAGSEIIHIVGTVAVVQFLCDLVARFMIFQKQPYQRSLKNLESIQIKHDKLEKEIATKSKTQNPKQQEKLLKRLKVITDDLGEARADVAKRHSFPGMITSIVFFMLMRVLWTEHGGKVIAVLPFTPITLLRKLTLRGLDFGSNTNTNIQFPENSTVTSADQACNFIAIYVLSTLSVKYYINKLFGVHPPPGADQGLMTVMESPTVAKGMRQLGVDPDALKDKTS